MGEAVDAEVAEATAPAPGSSRRLLLVDFVGHAFPVELSRTLARRTMTVDHVHLAGFVVGKGPLAPRAEDPDSLNIHSVDLGGPFPKYQVARRAAHELRFAAAALRLARRTRPDVMLLCTVPPLAQLLIVRGARALGIPCVVWLQDVLAEASRTSAAALLGRVRRFVSSVVDRAERASLRSSAHVVAISESFLPYVSSCGVAPGRVTVIENWAALSGLVVRPRDNGWARRHGLGAHPVALYAGTLGYKHDWRDLALLAQCLPAVDVVVVSEGEFADQLRSWSEARGLDNLKVIDFVPFGTLPDVLGAADVCIALLTDDASEFSVPSKVQSYLAAGRPVVVAGPVDGDASSAVVEADAGRAVPAGDVAALAGAVAELLEDPGDCGENARRWAEERFSVERKADQFVEVFARCIES